MKARPFNMPSLAALGDATLLAILDDLTNVVGHVDTDAKLATIWGNDVTDFRRGIETLTEELADRGRSQKWGTL